MSLTLEFWYYAGMNRADEPVLARSESDLDRVLADLLQQGVQPHPTQIAAQELPTFGILDLPDRMFKMDLDPESTIGALHYYGPDPNSETGESWSWASVSNEEITLWPPVLYIDKQNPTLFPPRSALTLETIKKALHEFHQTGTRPTCIQWQDTGGIA
ncbi:Imm1 family immunity protein [Lentzea sp. NPDC058436]|uniref:Imm1 family immunity protein n=1 Tax=Lentzea sp. NPDC058436 TaxID=3346499 RepID=UPI00364CA0C7